MYLIIQIPCFNEEDTLPETLADLPTAIPGVHRIEVLIIDDGSSDRTVDVAREHGVHHVVRFAQNRGLARAFMAGIDAGLRLGADVIVNTDGDNQYDASCIPELIAPIVEGRADMVVGDRRVDTIEHFSYLKKKLQHLGSAVVRRFSRTEVPDTTSGFRAFSREGALRLNLINEYTYTLETIIQAGQSNMALATVPIRTNPKTRESRLFRSIPQYVRRAGATIVRSYLMYRPMRTFLALGAAVFATGFALGLRFLWFYMQGMGSGKVQSVVLAGVLMLMGSQLVILGLIADLVASNRKLIEEGLYRLRRMEAGSDDA
jgi:glycosyltransferase involved in cell wall biosynthesis